MQVRRGKTIVELCQGDITAHEVDAIVNAANSRLAGGGGVDGAIHRAGGPAIMEACRKIGGCPAGQAVITTGGNLPARCVIHTVGPVYRDGRSGEPEILTNAYSNSLKLADSRHLSSLAFPSISTGAYGYPLRDAAAIALSAVMHHVQGGTGLKLIRFVLFSAHDFEVYADVLKELCAS